jgi:hypothetical protein
MRIAFFAAAALIAAPAAAANIPSEYENQLRAQINRADSLYRDRGYSRVMGPEMDGLGEGANDSYSVQLREGSSYAIHGVCDTDCSDLDLKIFDENNNLISEDTSTDDQPIVQVTPKWTGNFKLQVVMYDCNSAPCYYAVSVYRK